MPHHTLWLGAFVDGLDRHWVESCTLSAGACRDADLHVFWSMHHAALIAHCRATRQPFICVERGYIDRMNFSSVNLNGLNGESDLPVWPDDARCRKYGWDVQPVRPRGKFVILIGQVPGDKSLAGFDLNEWIAARHDYYRQAGIECAFRPHPLIRVAPPPGVPVYKGTLQDAFADALLFETISSTAAVDAWMAGTAARAASPVSMIYRWQGDYDRPTDPAGWLNDLSYRQYNLEEFSSGLVWDRIRPSICMRT